VSSLFLLSLRLFVLVQQLLEHHNSRYVSGQQTQLLGFWKSSALSDAQRSCKVSTRDQGVHARQTEGPKAAIELLLGTRWRSCSCLWSTGVFQLAQSEKQPIERGR
jgi:hypothetical protein